MRSASDTVTAGEVRTVPLTATRPATTQLSAVRREHRPARAITLAMRSASSVRAARGAAPGGGVLSRFGAPLRSPKLFLPPKLFFSPKRLPPASGPPRRSPNLRSPPRSAPRSEPRSPPLSPNLRSPAAFGPKLLRGPRASAPSAARCGPSLPRAARGLPLPGRPLPDFPGAGARRGGREDRLSSVMVPRHTRAAGLREARFFSASPCVFRKGAILPRLGDSKRPAGAVGSRP